MKKSCGSFPKSAIKKKIAEHSSFGEKKTVSLISFTEILSVFTVPFGSENSQQSPFNY